MCAKSRGLGRAGPGPSREWRLWVGPALEKVKAESGQAKAAAFGPSRAGTSLPVFSLQNYIVSYLTCF
ncbi:hypothetical protein L208DRAFT_1401223 [Tricholoma matsutake]|nr:hypothetical protein L208DRAFT_1401223 [Tricholoma matsutake 945]